MSQADVSRFLGKVVNSINSTVLPQPDAAINKELNDRADLKSRIRDFLDETDVDALPDWVRNLATKPITTPINWKQIPRS